MATKDGEDGNGLHAICTLKKRQDVSFSKVIVWLEIVEILQKCCCIVDFLQQIAFDLIN